MALVTSIGLHSVKVPMSLTVVAVYNIGAIYSNFSVTCKAEYLSKICNNPSVYCCFDVFSQTFKRKICLYK